MGVEVPEKEGLEMDWEYLTMDRGAHKEKGCGMVPTRKKEKGEDASIVMEEVTHDR